eukprot:2710839-Prorocentrum_lima.AAC.1
MALTTLPSLHDSHGIASDSSSCDLAELSCAGFAGPLLLQDEGFRPLADLLRMPAILPPHLFVLSQMHPMTPMALTRRSATRKLARSFEWHAMPCAPGARREKLVN